MIIHLTFRNMLRILKFLLTISLVLQIFCMTYGNAARILVSFPPTAGSHFILGKALVNGLLERGHEVTFINSFGMKKQIEGLNEIVLEDLNKHIPDMQKYLFDLNQKNLFQQFTQMIRDIYNMTYSVLNDSQVQQSIKNDKYDLVILDSIFNECHVGLAHHFDCPIIIVSTLGSNLWINSFVGNPAPPSYVNQLFGGNTINMTFMERVANNIISYLAQIIYYGYHLPKQNELLHVFVPDAPSLREIIQKRIALVFLNSHPSITPAKPLVPSMIEIGGFHISERNPFPKDLQIYLDNANEGFILFSMGSVFKSTLFPIETREALVKAFTQLPYKILWKYEDEQLPGKPDNVKIDKWLPQNDILAHPNLKLFITHGGLLSTTEAIYHGIPIVGIPIYADQKMNMLASEALGIGKTIQFIELTTEKLLSTVEEVINKKSYRNNAKYRSVLFRDQPLKPIDSAMYWIEYVLRHKYVDHLKVGSINLTWYQEMSLDVIGFLGSVLFAVLFVSYLIVGKCFRCLCNNRLAKIVSQRKKNQ